MYHIFFSHLSVNGHLDCFHILAVVNSASRVHISVSVVFFFFFGCVACGIKPCPLQWKRGQPEVPAYVFLIYGFVQIYAQE